MAINGYKDVVATRTSSGNVGDTLRFEWRQTAQSISVNYTDINWKMSLISGGAGKISSSASKSWSVTVDGQNFSGSNTVGIGNNATKVLASGTKRVYHDNDGTKRLYVSFSQVFNINFNGHIGTVSGSSNWDLNTIPRASAFTVSGDTIGSPITVTIDTHSSDFRHTLWYHLPGQGWQEVAYGIVTQHSFTIPIAECSFLPNSVSGNLELRLRTLNGGTQIGSDVYKTVTVYVPSTVAPTVDSILATEYNTDIYKQFNCFVQEKSRLLVISAGSGIYGSIIKKYTVTTDGKSYEGADITTEAIESSGQVPITVTVMDSRGRKANKTVNITVAEYHRPFIRNFDAIRSDRNGVQQNSGTSLKCICDFEISAVGNKNTKRYVIEYRKKSDEMWTQAFSGSVYTLTDSFIQKDILGVEFPYVVRLTVTDFFESITFEDVIGSAIVPWCVHPSGKGFGVGGYPEGEFFQCFMPTEFKQSVTIANALGVQSGGTGANNPDGARRNLEVCKLFPATWITPTTDIAEATALKVAEMELPAGDYIIIAEVLIGFQGVYLPLPTNVNYIVKVQGQQETADRKVTWGGDGGSTMTIRHLEEPSHVEFHLYTNAKARVDHDRIRFNAIRL